MIEPIWLMQPIPYFGEPLEYTDYIIEPKIDGWRLQVIISDGNIKYFGRRLDKHPDWTNKLSYLNPLFTNMPPGTLLDCELTTIYGRRYIPSLFANCHSNIVQIYIFDIVYYNGSLIANLPLITRKIFLFDAVHQLPELRIVPFYFLEDLYSQVSLFKRYGYEGAVIKHIDSPYIIGENAPGVSHYWRKIK
jgi:ATP-dependent DNA ligase